MLTVFAALVPIFLLIVLGFGLRRTWFTHDMIWTGLEQLVYYVTFPALLVDSLGRAKLESVPIAGVGGALFLSVTLMSGICLMLRPILARTLGMDGPAFTSLFQGSTRWQTFVGLSVASSLWGNLGITLASVAMVAMIPLLNVFCVAVLAHYASPQRLSWRAVGIAVIRNPLIIACLFGLALNFAHVPIPGPVHEFLDSLGRCSLATGLLVVGAGLHFEGLRKSGGVALVTVMLKLAVLPSIAIALGILFGVSGTSLAVVACCSSVPCASNSYILARQMGGDAPLMAQIITLQTLIAIFTMPVFIAAVA